MLEYLLLSLTCYRLSQLFAYDEGPASIFHRIRVQLGAYKLDKQGRPETNLGRLISCPYCLGLWIALFEAIAFRPFPEFIIWWLGIAGLQAFLQGLSK